MKKIHILIILALAFIIVGCSSTIQTSQEEILIEENTSPVVEKETTQVEVIEETNEVQIETDLEEIQQIEVENTTSDSALFVNSYRDFNQEEYNLALNSDYYVVLDFYSDWCPSCNKEDIILQENFNNLENLVIFKVNHGDSQTSPEEEALAEQFDISKRDSGIILKDNVEFTRYLGHKNKEEYMEIFNSLS